MNASFFHKYKMVYKFHWVMKIERTHIRKLDKYVRSILRQVDLPLRGNFILYCIYWRKPYHTVPYRIHAYTQSVPNFSFNPVGGKVFFCFTFFGKIIFYITFMTASKIFWLFKKLFFRFKFEFSSEIWIESQKIRISQ